MVLWACGAAWAVSVEDVPNPRPGGSWVSDQADVLDPSAEATLDARLTALEHDLGAEVAVVTVDSVGTDVPKAFATALFARWGIGKADANNGLLVLLVLDQRRIEIETGYGLEPLLPDAWVSSLEDREMVPRFKTGDYGGGLVAGVAEVDRNLRAHAEEARTGRPEGFVAPGGRLLAQVGVAGGAGLLGLGGAAAAAFTVRRRRRTCEKCRVYMPMLDEAADDAHLSRGEQVEERVGSVDYQVHQCPSCGDVRTFARNQWFSNYRRCDQCGQRTRTSVRETLVAATTMSTGRVRISESCANCTYRAIYERNTPRLQQHTSSSSGGFGGGGGDSGGSFGGGHSGGGGAGHSW